MVKATAKVHAASPQTVSRRSDDWLWSDAIYCLGRLGDREGAPIERLKDALHTGRCWVQFSEPTLRHNDLGISNFIWPTGSLLPVMIDFTNAIPAPAEWDLAGLAADCWLFGPRFASAMELRRFLIDRYLELGMHVSADKLEAYLESTVKCGAIAVGGH